MRERSALTGQRIHEDARHLTELSTDLGIGLLQSSLLFGSFIGVLWMLSGNVVFSRERAQFCDSRLHGLVRPGIHGHRLLD